MKSNTQAAPPSAPVVKLEAASPSSFTTSDQPPPKTNSTKVVLDLTSSPSGEATQRAQAVRPLSELLSETGVSSPKLAEETGIAYTTIRHLATGFVRRPKEENARAILTVLNYHRAKSPRDLPLLKLEDVKEFTHLRTNTPSADKLARLAVADTVASSPPRTRTRTRKGKKGTTDTDQPRKPGRPPGRKNNLKPGLTKPLGASELFLSEFVVGNLPRYMLLQTGAVEANNGEGDKPYIAIAATVASSETLTNTPTRATRLLDKAIEELRQSKSLANLSLTPQAFTLKTTQAALADPTLQTSLGQVEVQLITKPNQSEPLVRLNLVKAGSEANKPSQVELTLSLEEFTQLSLLQLYLIKHSQSLPPASHK